MTTPTEHAMAAALESCINYILADCEMRAPIVPGPEPTSRDWIASDIVSSAELALRNWKASSIIQTHAVDPAVKDLFSIIEAAYNEAKAEVSGELLAGNKYKLREALIRESILRGVICAARALLAKYTRPTPSA